MSLEAVFKILELLLYSPVTISLVALGALFWLYPRVDRLIRLLRVKTPAGYELAFDQYFNRPVGIEKPTKEDDFFVAGGALGATGMALTWAARKGDEAGRIKFQERAVQSLEIAIEVFQEYDYVQIAEQLSRFAESVKQAKEPDDLWNCVRQLNSLVKSTRAMLVKAKSEGKGNAIASVEVTKPKKLS